MRRFYLAYALWTSVLLASCTSGSSLSSKTEAVLIQGMKISAATPSGKIVIKGGPGASRTYSGQGWSKSSVLIQRDTRWSGSLGLYDPADSFTLGNRLLVEEGRQYFASESEALRYMQRLKGYYGPLTYNNSGLVVAYKVIDIPNESPTRELEVWQFYIKGKRPASLRGANDSSIEVSGGQVPDQSTPASAPIGYERELADTEYAPN